MHIVINWRSMTGYFKKTIPLAIIGIFIILTALSFFRIGGANGYKNMKMAMKSSELLESAPVGMIAQLSEVTPKVLLSV